MIRRTFLAGCVLALSACALNNDNQQASGNGILHIVNAARQMGDLHIYIDGTDHGPLAVADVGTASGIGGLHVLEVRTGSGLPGFTYNFAIAGSEAITVVVTDSSGALNHVVLVDSNTVVPAGASKLRVGHFAKTIGPIDVWRTQPDYATPIRLAFPFPYGFTSNYVQSTPGDWKVLVSDTIPAATPTAPMPDTLGMTAAITVPDGGSRTVIIVDGATPHTASFVVMVP
jgi:hypothetical protein